MNHADHHRRQRSFDRAQRQYDNMSPPEDPRDGMDEPEVDGEMEAAQEKVEAVVDRAEDERKDKELDAMREVPSAAFVEVTDDHDREQGGERWLRRIDQKCWISVLHRRTGFGWMEWETAIVFIIEPGSRQKRWEGDDRDCLIIAGDRRDELATMPKEQLRDWYTANIEGNRNSMETVIHALKHNEKGQP